MEDLKSSCPQICDFTSKYRGYIHRNLFISLIYRILVALYVAEVASPNVLWRAVLETWSLANRTSPSWVFGARRNHIGIRERGWGRSKESFSDQKTTPIFYIQSIIQQHNWIYRLTTASEGKMWNCNKINKNYCTWSYASMLGHRHLNSDTILRSVQTIFPSFISANLKKTEVGCSLSVTVTARPQQPNVNTMKD